MNVYSAYNMPVPSQSGQNQLCYLITVLNKVLQDVLGTLMHIKFFGYSFSINLQLKHTIYVFNVSPLMLSFCKGCCVCYDWKWVLSFTIVYHVHFKSVGIRQKLLRCIHFENILAVLTGFREGCKYRASFSCIGENIGQPSFSFA